MNVVNRQVSTIQASSNITSSEQVNDAVQGAGSESALIAENPFYGYSGEAPPDSPPPVLSASWSDQNVAETAPAKPYEEAAVETLDLGFTPTKWYTQFAFAVYVLAIREEQEAGDGVIAPIAYVSQVVADYETTISRNLETTSGNEPKFRDDDAPGNDGLDADGTNL